ncbi:SDR family NAD(P)-dependent oxidoreductase [Thioalkalivibrio paradoxus]|uniref:Short-chain dehydrogenase n=1 Tax=Thioalkalivibrio paradoxus ARh 1 TaxID=713585 RepID=W0DGQ2_9GAMM|nr:SDR family NAD(P)-dependent oxidoreductase [Thioalkalivibrio paradoxus]AHE97804.1 short-chain dehydrogenase [Thioalkalivibrio paradoxus ARh 1]
MQDSGAESVRTALITGNSSGLGLGLTRVLGRQGTAVYGLSRRGCPDPVAGDVRVDLAEHDRIAPALGRLLEGVEQLDLVVLNAGILGRIQRMQDADLAELKQGMDVNVWANKVILDELLRRRQPVGQIVAISSGAAVFGSRGWSGYALSKAALNMLVQLYAHEFPGTPVHSLAPGLVETAMQDYLCEEADAGAFPGLERLRKARGTDDMPGPEAAAQQVLDSLAALRAEPSRHFVDLRALRDPDAYQRLLASKAAER